MNENSNVVSLRQPDAIDDPLTNILRSGARQLLTQAVEMEAAAFLAEMKDLKLADGRDRLARISHKSERTEAPNQRKLLCPNDFALIRGSPDADRV